MMIIIMINILLKAFLILFILLITCSSCVLSIASRRCIDHFSGLLLFNALTQIVFLFLTKSFVVQSCKYNHHRIECCQIINNSSPNVIEVNILIVLISRILLNFESNVVDSVHLNMKINWMKIPMQYDYYLMMYYLI